MVKPEWGTRRQCPVCAVRFYDLRKNPMTCPKCNATFDLEDLFKTKKVKGDANSAKIRESDLSLIDIEVESDSVILDDIDDDVPDDLDSIISVDER